jgi:hypothetical protein
MIHTEKNVFKNLLSWSQSWAEIVEQHGFHTIISCHYPKQVLIQAIPKTMVTQSFICELEYKTDDSNTAFLSIKSVSKLNHGAYIKAILKEPQINGDMIWPFYLWDHYDLYDADIFDENTVMETLGIIFEIYFRRTYGAA